MFKNELRFKTKRKLRKNFRKKIKHIQWKFRKITKTRTRNVIKFLKLWEYINRKWKFPIIDKLNINISKRIRINKLKIRVKNKGPRKYKNRKWVKIKTTKTITLSKKWKKFPK